MKTTTRYDLQIGCNQFVLPYGTETQDVCAVREVPRLYCSVPTLSSELSSEDPHSVDLRIDVVGIGSNLPDRAQFISSFLLGGSEFQAWLIP